MKNYLGIVAVLFAGFVWAAAGASAEPNSTSIFPTSCVLSATFGSLEPDPDNITSVSPRSGPTSGGTDVRLRAKVLSTSGTTRVLFGGVEATNVTVSYYAYNGTYYLHCTAPAHDAGSVDIIVISPDQTSSIQNNAFEYVGTDPPSPAGITPASGWVCGGTSVRIDGTGFTRTGRTRVLFGEEDATDVNVHPDDDGSHYIVCTSPGHAVGIADVTVINPSGESGILYDAFEYLWSDPDNITSVNPRSGLMIGGTNVRLRAKTLSTSGTTRVLFGGVEATNVTVSYSAYNRFYYLWCTAPAHDAGSVDVVVINPNQDSSIRENGFEYLWLDPDNILHVRPRLGSTSGGTSVRITAKTLSTSGTTRVLFGGVEATNVTISYSGYNRFYYLHCTAPAHDAGSVDLIVTSPNQDASIRKSGFEYVESNPPSPTSITPASGWTYGGTSVRIDGTGFTKTGRTRVLFGEEDATDVKVRSDDGGSHYIVCTSPGHAAGIADVTVINPSDESGILDNAFEFVQPDPPNPTSVTPASGWTCGGTNVRIDGAYFIPSVTTRVVFGEVDATDVTVSPDDSGGHYILCKSPAHAAGIVDVTVINTGGESGIVYDVFEFIQEECPELCAVTCDTVIEDSGLVDLFDKGLVALVAPIAADATHNGIDEESHMTLVERLLTDADEPGHCCAVQAWQNNNVLVASALETLDPEFAVLTPLLQIFLSGYATVGPASILEDFIFGANAVLEPPITLPMHDIDGSAWPYLAADGDADLDGVCNLAEYRAVLCASPGYGIPADFEEAATNPAITENGGGCSEPCYENVPTCQGEGEYSLPQVIALALLGFFTGHDLDLNHGLSYAESWSTLNEIMGDGSAPFTEEDMFNALDKDGDGYLSTGELQQETPPDTTPPVHACDQDADGSISLSELLRLVQFLNSDGYHCAENPGDTEDGYLPGPGSETCKPHTSDYNAQDWAVGMPELLRLIQFFNAGGYHTCPDANPPTEDGYCPASD